MHFPVEKCSFLQKNALSCRKMLFFFGGGGHTAGNRRKLQEGFRAQESRTLTNLNKTIAHPLTCSVGGITRIIDDLHSLLACEVGVPTGPPRLGAQPSYPTMAASSWEWEPDFGDSNESAIAEEEAQEDIRTRK